jgi:CBS domain-containing protein
MNQLKDLMSPDVKIVGPDVSIREAASQMRDGDFGMMPVVDPKGGLIGTISDRDIAIRAVAHGLSVETKVRDVMSKGVSSALDTDTVEDAVRIMSEHQVRRLPVMDQDRNLVGIVALGDLAVKDERKPAAQALSQISRP